MASIILAEWFRPVLYDSTVIMEENLYGIGNDAFAQLSRLFSSVISVLLPDLYL